MGVLQERCPSFLSYFIWYYKLESRQWWFGKGHGKEGSAVEWHFPLFVCLQFGESV